MNSAPEIAVIIVSYNTRDLLLECLASVAGSAASYEVELLVVDNGSEDGSCEEARRVYPQTTTICNDVNLGFGAACNQGIRATGAPYILLLNSDARLTPQALRALYDCMRSNERCGAAGCELISPSGARMNNTKNFLTPFNQALELLGIRLPSRYLGRTHEPKIEPGQTDCDIDWIDGACLMLRRAALDEIGLLDEQFFMYSEDEDLCSRLKAHKWLICFSRAGTAIHHGGATSKKYKRDMLFHFYRSQMLYLLKHNGRLSVSFYMMTMSAVLRLKRVSSRLSSRSLISKELCERLSALKQARASVSGKDAAK